MAAAFRQRYLINWNNGEVGRFEALTKGEHAVDDSFDPYRDWLGITAGERPPDHYALLGLPRCESSYESIRSAAARRTAQVMKYRLGEHAPEATRLLGELAGALHCLSNAARKEEYDAQLQQQTIAPAGEMVPGDDGPPLPRPIPLPRSTATPQGTPSTAGGEPSTVERRYRRWQPLAAYFFVLLLTSGGFAIYRLGRHRPVTAASVESKLAKSTTPVKSSRERKANRPPDDQRDETPVLATAPSPAVDLSAAAPLPSADEPKPSESGSASLPEAKNLPPVVEFATSGSEQFKAGDTLAISLSGRDPDNDLLAYEFRTGGDAWRPAPNGQVTLRDLKVGPLIVEARARDTAGNYSGVINRAWEIKPQPSTLPKAWTNSIGMRFTLIPAGEFLMGDPNAKDNADNPQHRVRITKPFYMALYEVTEEEYARVTKGKKGKGSERSKWPVQGVPWSDATKFCRRLAALPEEKLAQRRYRLPTEAEWEFACRAGTTMHFHFGDQCDGQQANCGGVTYIHDKSTRFGLGKPTGVNLRRRTDVGSYAPNSWGLYDMHGNVAEWCLDVYWGKFYGVSPENDPVYQSIGSYRRVVRGGSYGDDSEECESAYRKCREPDSSHSYNVGIRVVCEE